MWAVLLACCLVAIAAHNPTNSSEAVISGGQQQGPTKKQIVSITKRFVNYYLYFGHKPEGDGGFPADVCYGGDYPNTTQALLTNSITSSVNSNYTPRILARNQVSWKPNGKSKCSQQRHGTEDIIMSCVAELICRKDSYWNSVW